MKELETQGTDEKMIKQKEYEYRWIDENSKKHERSMDGYVGKFVRCVGEKWGIKVVPLKHYVPLTYTH